MLNFSEKIFMDFHDFFWYDAYKNNNLYCKKIREFDINNLYHTDYMYVNDTFFLFKFYDNNYMKYYII